MADGTLHGGKDAPRSDRLYPALLDRLTKNVRTKDSQDPEAAVMTRASLRNAVLRDLAWLLNTANLESQVDLSSFPAVRSSVLNFGIAALAGRRVANIDWQDLEIAIKNAIIAFEPRVLPDTISVRGVSASSSLDHHNVLSFEIRGQLWAVPYPLELLLRSKIDLESGQVVVEEHATAATS